MKSLFSRVFVALFVLSIVASPYQQVSAEDISSLPQATPVASETPIVDGPVDGGTDPVSEPGEGTDEVPAPTPSGVGGEATPDGQELQKPAGDSGIQPLALDDDSAYFSDPWFSGSLLSMQGQLSPGGIVDAGETLTFTYSNEYLTLDETPVSFTVNGPVTAAGTAQANQSTGTITVTFAEGFEVGGSWAYFQYEIPGTAGDFPECRDLPRAHYNYVDILYGLPFGQTSSQRIEDDEWCEGTGLPDVDWMNFDPFVQQFSLDLYIESSPPAGHEITITYPADQVIFSPGTTSFYLYNYTTGEETLVATGSASDGVLTITFLEFGIDEGDEWDSWAYGNFHATLNDAVCVPSGELYYEELDDIVFTASTGLVETTWIEGRLCNAAAPTKSGAWSADGERIVWTIDTGDLIDGARIQDIGGPGDYTFDCSTLVVVPAYPGVAVDDSWCDPGDSEYSGGFYLYLYGEELVRATITIEAIPHQEPMLSAYINCAIVEGQGGNPEVDRAENTGGTGYGGPVCAEVFPEGGGDFITKTVSDTEVDSGEPITYTVTASTTSDLWFSLDVIDELPEGFVVTDTSCAVTPAQFQTNPCSVLSESNVLTASAVNDWTGMEEPVGGGVEVVLTIEGYFDVEQDTVFVNEACSERMIDIFFGSRPAPTALSMGDPEILGGGVICASANVTVLADVPAETPTETAVPTETVTPTSTPATPTETPTETTVPVIKETVIRVEMWDGSNIEGTGWSLYAPVASQVMADAYLTGVLDANNSTMFTDLPAGDYRFVVTPAGMSPQEFMVNVTNENQEIVVYVPGPVSATPDATPGSTETAAPTASGAVTGLPATGTAGSGAGNVLIVATGLAAVMLMAFGVGIRIRSPRA